MKLNCIRVFHSFLLLLSSLSLLLVVYSFLSFEIIIVIFDGKCK